MRTYYKSGGKIRKTEKGASLKRGSKKIGKTLKLVRLVVERKRRWTWYPIL